MMGQPTDPTNKLFKIISKHFHEPPGPPILLASQLAFNRL